MNDDTAPLWLGDDEPMDEFVSIRSVMEPDARITLWLIDDRESACTTPIEIPEHEGLGRLPVKVRQRINPCGAATASGHPCKNIAAVGSAYCTNHRSLAVTDALMEVVLSVVAKHPGITARELDRAVEPPAPTATGGRRLAASARLRAVEHGLIDARRDGSALRHYPGVTA